jgi:sugar/nucleoside kinase (ribokinase family)
VVIKRGAEGAYLACENNEFFIPVFPVQKVLDPTGAGDSFAGGFMGYLSQTNKPDFLEAVLVGSAMASFCVEGFGLESLLKTTPSLLSGRIDAIKNSLLEKPCA